MNIDYSQFYRGTTNIPSYLSLIHIQMCIRDRSHPDWWQDKKNPDRHGIRIPVLDENGVQKVGARNRKQWKRGLTDATGWNNPKNQMCIRDRAQERLDTIMEQMKAAEGVTEDLKRTRQMEWVQRCNNIHNRAEEIVLHEMIYS